MNRYAQDSSGFVGFKQTCPGALHNSVRDALCPGVFQNRKNKTFRLAKKFLTLPGWEKRSIVGGHPSNRQEQNSRKKMCRLVIVELGQRLGRMRNKYVKRSQQWTENLGLGSTQYYYYN